MANAKTLTELLARLRSGKSKGQVTAGGVNISESVFTPPPKGGKEQPSRATIQVEGARIGDTVLRRFTFGATRAAEAYAHLDNAIAFSEATGLTVQGFTLNQLRVLKEHANVIMDKVASMLERGLGQE